MTQTITEAEIAEGEFSERDIARANNAGEAITASIKARGPGDHLWWELVIAVLHHSAQATARREAALREALMGEPYDALVNAGKKLLMHDVTASRRCHFAATRLEELAALEART